MSEGSRHFEREGAVQNALRKVTKRLEELHIPYAVAGAMAMFQHGYRRFTEDVDLLVTRDGLRQIHAQLEGLGYVPVFTGSKNLRDAELGVRIEFIVTGQYPGDGKQKPVAFPDPEEAAVERDGIRVLSLSKLIELKLASGLSNPERAKDIGDVQELIKALRLPASVADELDPSVRQKFTELWTAVYGRQKRYVRLWRNKFLTLEVKSIDQMIDTLRAASEELAAMKADGVVLDSRGGTADDYAYLVTTDATVAQKYDMHEESEFFDNEDELADDEDAASNSKK